MTISQLPVRVGNEILIDQYVIDIKSELGTSTSAWKRIAEIFAAAQEQFGRKSKAMSELAKKTEFSTSKIDKLVAIAKSKRLKSESNFFSEVTTWTVLYEVTTLTDDQYQILLSKLTAGETLSLRLITSIRKPKDETPNPFQQFATIQLDMNAVRAGLIDQDEYETLVQAIQMIADRVPYVKVTVNDLIEKNDEKRTTELEREITKVTHKAFMVERDKFLNRIKVKHGTEYWKMRRAELREVTEDLITDGDFAAAFEIIESDMYDPQNFYSEAAEKIWNRREAKFGTRVSKSFTQHNLVMLPRAA
jgi:hypothetical protein